jgi:hypothetical protein
MYVFLYLSRSDKIIAVSSTLELPCNDNKQDFHSFKTYRLQQLLRPTEKKKSSTS